MANENQLIGLTTLGGSEVMEVQESVGGSGAFVNISTVRNGRDMLVVTGSGAATTVMTSANSTLMWHGTAPTTWAITLPTPAGDGCIVTIGTDTTLTTMVTVTAPTGMTLNATYSNQTLTAVTSIAFQYDLPSTTWYRLR